MKHILITTIAAVLLVGCGPLLALSESQESTPPEEKPAKPGDEDTSDGDKGGQDSQQVDNNPLSELQQLTEHGVGNNEIRILKKWNRIYSQAPDWVKEKENIGQITEEEKKTYYEEVKVELEKWKTLVIKAALTQVGNLPDPYRDKDQIKDIKDLPMITQWQEAYTQWRDKTNELSEVWGSLPKGLTEKEVIAKLDDRFEELAGISPPKFKGLLSDQRSYVKERDLYLKTFVGKSRAQIYAMLPKPNNQLVLKKGLNPPIRCDYIRKSGHTLKLHFVYLAGINDYEVEKVELIRRK